jgi:hypothetical protein
MEPGGSNEMLVMAFVASASVSAPETVCWPYNCKLQTRMATPIIFQIEVLNRIFIFAVIELTATRHSSQRNCHVRSVEQPRRLFPDPTDSGGN